MEITIDKSTKVPFKVFARTAKLIGLENFSNEEGAIIELVKNTYDADAKNCLLIFDLKYKTSSNGKGEEIITIDSQNSRIYIIDNGTGMTESIISNQWMTIGTDDKYYHPTSPDGRVKTGAKGIGRFALNRLGMLTDLFTVSGETKRGLEWMVDWREFDKQGAIVSDVEAVLTPIDSLNLKDKIFDRFNGYEKIRNLVNNISFESGTIIEISELNDKWETNQLERLFGNLEVLMPPKEQSDFRIDFFSTNSIDQFGKVKSAFYDDFDYKIESSYGENEEGSANLEIKITRNELDVNSLANSYAEVFDYDAMRNFPYRLEDFKERTITICKNLDEVLPDNVEKGLVDQIGRFKFTFYFLKLGISDDKGDRDVEKKYPYKRIDSAHRKSWLKKFGGVKIFRDEFRVRPYGENGEDWLKLGERQVQSPGGPGQRLGGYRIGPNQISGTINISRIYNVSFQDKSGREGIIENSIFELFKNIIKEIIAIFEKDRNTIMYHLSQLYIKRNKEAVALIKAQEEAAQIKLEQERDANKATITQNQNGEEGQEKVDDQEKTDKNHRQGYSEREKVLAEGVQILQDQNDKKDDEIRLLRSLASIGLIISSFAHEVKSLQHRLIPRTAFLLRELKTHLDEQSLDHLDRDDNPFYMIQLMQEEDTKLKHWLDYSLNTLKRDKRERTNLDFSDYFKRFKSTWSKAVLQRDIDIILEENGGEDCIIRVFEVDMDSIFNNLLSNSMNALKGNSNEKKSIVINWKCVEDNVEIIFSDNGKGLDNRYQNNPEEIFNLHETSKTDNKGNVIGTGLGLYIVKTIIEDYNNSSISIIGFTKGLQLKITFKARR